MSDRLAKQVAERLREDYSDSLAAFNDPQISILKREALPALAELVARGQACGAELDLLADTEGAIAGDASHEWDEALRRVAESLGITTEGTNT